MLETELSKLGKNVASVAVDYKEPHFRGTGPRDKEFFYHSTTVEACTDYAAELYVH